MAIGAAPDQPTPSSPALRRIRAQQSSSGPGPGPAAPTGASGAQGLLRSGAVRPVRPKEAALALEAEGFRLLDVRPAWERARAPVPGSVHVPLFVEDEDAGPLTLVKKWVHFGYVGLWTGQAFTRMNHRFLPETAAAVPDREARLLVACGEGLRSLIALKMLHEDGYKNLGWLAGGFNKCTDGDFAQVEGDTKLQYATIGGVSYIFLQILLLLRVVN